MITITLEGLAAFFAVIYLVLSIIYLVVSIVLGMCALFFN